MLVSGGQILAIDQVYTDNRTISGDGVQKPLGVKTDIIATNATVSSVSSKLEQNIDYVSGHLPTVTAGKNVGVEVSATPDGRPLYIVSADDVEQREIHIIGNNGVSATFNETTSSWNIGVSANYLSANALNNYYNKTQVDDKLTATSSWANGKFQEKGNYVSASDFNQFKTDVNAALDKKQDVSAMTAYAQSAWVNDNYQKKGNYVSADDFDEYKTQVSQEFANTSSWATGKFQEKGDYVSATEFNEYKEQVDNEFESTSAWANETFQAKGDYVSATEFDDYKTEVSQEFTNTSSWANETFQPIGEYISASEKFLSANALDDLSGKWESVYNTTVTASGSWNEASAFAANSAKFVTSAGVEFNPTLAYFLKKSEESVVWSGVDLSDLGKMYQISSLTPDLISAGISADEQNNPFYVLSAAAPEQVATPDISGYGLSAWKDTEDNKYFVSANIVGNHGISAGYDAEANQWNVGISANEYAYYSNTYENNAGESVDSNTIIKFVDGISHNITVDSDGYITLPDTGNKFTVCINETVTDNTDSNTHSYLLNKIQLCSKHENDADAVLVSTNNYYATEVGSSDATIAYTLTNTPNTKYFVKYAGSKIDVSKDPNAKLHIVISILEEISSLATTEGGGAFYTGIEPIYVEDASNKIGLAYDREQFQIVPGTDTDHPELSALQINIHTTGGDIDQEAFEKLAGMINSRMTETYPIASVKYEHTIDASCQLSYLFRPTIEYDCTSATSAFIYAGNADSNTLVSVAIYDAMNLVNDKVPLVWCSEATNVQGSPGGQRILPANMAYTANFGTIHPEGLYYASIRVTNHVLNNAIGDIDGVTVTGDIDIGNPKPWVGLLNISNHDWPTSTNNLGSMANAHFKAYIGFKNN